MDNTLKIAVAFGATLLLIGIIGVILYRHKKNIANGIIPSSTGYEVMYLNETSTGFPLQNASRTTTPSQDHIFTTTNDAINKPSRNQRMSVNL